MKVGLFVTDVDGCLTDGRITYVEDVDGTGQPVIRRAISFYSRDMHGFAMLRQAKVKTAFISGNSSAAVQHRATRLGIDYVRLGVPLTGKLDALLDIATAANIPLEHVAYMGDDRPDLMPLLAVGLPMIPADAHLCVHSAAKWMSSAPGGRGAVREACDYILREHLAILDALDADLRDAVAAKIQAADEHAGCAEHEEGGEA